MPRLRLTADERRDRSWPSQVAGDRRRRESGDITGTGIHPADWELVKADCERRGVPLPSLVPPGPPTIHVDAEAEEQKHAVFNARLGLYNLACAPLTGLRKVHEADDWAAMLANAVVDMVLEDLGNDLNELRRLTPAFSKGAGGPLPKALQTFMRRSYTMYGSIPLPASRQHLPASAGVRAELRRRWDERLTPLYTLL